MTSSSKHAHAHAFHLQLYGPQACSICLDDLAQSRFQRSCLLTMQACHAELESCLDSYPKMYTRFCDQLKAHINSAVDIRRSRVVQDLHAAAVSRYASQSAQALEAAKEKDPALSWTQIEDLHTRSAVCICSPASQLI